MVVKWRSLEWIDIHTHHPGRGICVLDPCLGEVEFPTAGVVYRSLGIHPLLITEQAEKQLQAIEKAAADRKIVAVGEAGLDRNGDTPIAEQLHWFRGQAEIANRYRLPLLVHGVRAIPEIIALRNEFRDPAPWIMHGFNNRKELLSDLLRHGFCISVGHQILNQASNIYQNILEIPDEALFLETDNAGVSIEEIYRAVALRKGISITELQRIVEVNFERLFLRWNG